MRGVLCHEPRTGVADDGLEASHCLRGFALAVLAHRRGFEAEVRDNGEQGLLRLRERGGDADLRGAEVGAEAQHIAVASRAPRVQLGDHARLAHALHEARPQDGRCATAIARKRLDGQGG